MEPGDGVRYVSFTFDDGIFPSCRQAADTLEGAGFRGTFFVVSSWVGDRTFWVNDRVNRGLDHGEWSDLRDLAGRGHEIGSHSHRHFNAKGRVGRYLPWLLARDYRRAREVIGREVGTPPDSMAMPFNARNDNSDRVCTSLFRRIVAANSKGEVNPKGSTGPLLKGWAPGEGVPAEDVSSRIRGLRPGEWLVLQFHGFDGLGWSPFRSSEFERMVKACGETERLKVVTVRQGPGGS